MSKIGKKQISVPQGVTITVQDSVVTVRGSKGEMNRAIPESLGISVAENSVTIAPNGSASDENLSQQWGLYRSLLRNMIIGVSEGFQKSLEFQGVGYKAVPKGNDLELNLGFSHPIFYKAPEGVSFKVEKNIITVSGIDKELIGQVAAEIRSYRLPEPYKGSGIRYVGEIIRKKAGKKAVAAGA